jgi:hypothetical protein
VLHGMRRNSIRRKEGPPAASTPVGVDIEFRRGKVRTPTPSRRYPRFADNVIPAPPARNARPSPVSRPNTSNTSTSSVAAAGGNDVDRHHPEGSRCPPVCSSTTLARTKGRDCPPVCSSHPSWPERGVAIARRSALPHRVGPSEGSCPRSE